MQPVISLQNVTKKFGDKTALNGVSLDIPEGVVFALLGENGAGKTTMIRILTGFAKPDSGTASVLGQQCGKDNLAIRQAIGYVSDTPALYEWMTAEEIGWFTSAFYDEMFPDRYLELTSAFDVPYGLPIKKMSKGQRAKVALALATAHDPKLLILDEPTSGLDPMVRRQFLESMVDRAALGRTVLLSSHQISEVERVADWVGFLHEGSLKLVQPLDQLKESTSIITATIDDPAATVSLPPGEVLTELKVARQVKWVVRDLPPEWETTFAAESGIANLRSAPATLEDIFLSVCDPNASRPMPQDSCDERFSLTPSQSTGQQK